MAAEGDPGDNPGGLMGGEKMDEGQMNEDKLRAIFKKFDSDGSGSIDVGELQDAMRMLGVKCSANSAKKVLDVIDTDKNGTVEWEEFFTFFGMVQDPEEIKSLLNSVNQKFIDYKQQVENDPNFQKKFYLPPMISCRQKFARHNDNVEAVCWLTDDKFASCCIDGEIMVWDANDTAKNVKPLQTLVNPSEKGFYCMNATRNGQFVFAGSGALEKNVSLWDLAKEEIVQEFTGHKSACYCLSLAADESRFATGGKNGLVIVYDKKSPDPSCVIEGHENTVHGVSYREDCNTICSCSGDGTIKIWDLKAVTSAKAQACIEDAAATGVVYACHWRGEHEILSCGDDFCIKRWDIRNISQGSLTNYFGHTSTVKRLCLSPDEKFFMSSTNDGSIRVWLADEIGVINDAQANANNSIEQKKAQMEKMEAKIENGELDPMEMMQAKAQLKAFEEEKTYLDAVRKERDSVGCVQARVALDGHTLSVTALAWRDGPDKESSVISGSQDQTIRVFDIDREALEQFELWSKEEDEPEARRPSKDTYRRPSKLA